MSIEQNKAILREFVSAADQQNFDKASSFLSPNLVVHITGAPGPLDRPTFMQFGMMWHSAFPDEQTTFETQIAEGDLVVSQMTSRATHTGEFQGIPPTGKRVQVSGIWIDRVVNNQIVERWGQVDMLGLMQQLGAIPAP